MPVIDATKEAPGNLQDSRKCLTWTVSCSIQKSTQIKAYVFRAGCDSPPAVRARERLRGLQGQQIWCDSRADGYSPDERRGANPQVFSRGVAEATGHSLVLKRFSSSLLRGAFQCRYRLVLIQSQE